MKISRRALREAIDAGKRIDASPRVVRSHIPDIRGRLLARIPGIRGRALAQPGHVPAFSLARFQCLDGDPSAKLLTPTVFERLSLVARTIAVLKLDGASAELKTEMRGHLDALSLWPDHMPTVEVGDLEAVIADVTADLAIASMSSTRPTLAARRGLQLIGCRIHSPDGRPLNLSNVRLPFSLSFVGCIFETPFIADHAEMVSLDLSGSALVGLQAYGVRTSGDLRLRRSMVQSPIGLSGARIGGLFDGADLLVLPSRDWNREQIVEADHGMLNLSQATVENELRLDRARIWGGLSLRGAVANRSLVMTGAVVVSPIGVLLKWASDILRNWQEPEPGGAEPLGSVDARLAAHVLHSSEWPRGQPQEAAAPGTGAHPSPDGAITSSERVHLVALETLGPASVWNGAALRDLLTESMRARGNAVRADSLTVRGGLNAEHLYAGGRIRMKYADIQGAFRMSGSTLRSAAAIRADLDELEGVIAKKLDHSGDEDQANPIIRAEWMRLRALRESTSEAFRTENGGPQTLQDYSLDFRESRLNGDFILERSDRSEPALAQMKSVIYPKVAEAPFDSADYAHIAGRLYLSGAEITGNVTITKAVCEWWPLVYWPRGRPLMGAAKPEIVRMISDSLEPKSSAWDNGSSSRFDPDRVDRRRASVARGLQPPMGGPFLCLDQARIGRDLDLRDSVDIWGVSFEDGRVGGSIRFCNDHEHMQASQDGDGFVVECKHRPHALAGTVSIRNSRIDGDVNLTFDANLGPDLNCELVQVGGTLAIYPARSVAKAIQDLGTDRVEGFHLKPHLLPRRQDPAKQKRGVRNSSESWFIDLRNARATILCHPFPAWPKQDYLSLSGLRYERSSQIGPLPFIRRPDQSEHGRSGRVSDVDKPLDRNTTGLLFLSIFVVGFGLFVVLNFAFRGFTYDQHVNPDRYELFPLSLLLFTLPWLLFGGIWDRTRLMPRILPTSPVILTIWRLCYRNYVDIEATYYLSLQRHSPSRMHSSFSFSNYSSLEPYIVAADALREEGLLLGAEQVELERLDRRTAMLSWIHEGLFKLPMFLVGWLARYGYDLRRLVAVCALVLCMTFYGAGWFASRGWLEPTPPLDHFEAARLHCASAGCVLASRIEAKSVRDCVPPDPDARAPSIFYAAGLLIPGSKPVEDEPWQIAACVGAQHYPWRPMIRAAPEFVRFVGALLAAVLGLSIAARLESALARVKN